MVRVLLEKKIAVLILILALTVLLAIIFARPALQEAMPTEPVAGYVSLPSPMHDGEISVEKAIFSRVSTRHFTDEALNIQQVSQLLWAAGGKTVDGVSGPTRAFPSAGRLYPFEIFLVAGNVDELADGVYRFNWRDHSIELLIEGDVREDLMHASLGQGFVSRAPISIIWLGDFERARRGYGARGIERYIMMDVGGAGQNVHLQAEAMDLGTVIVGAFRDDAVKDILNTELIPLYIMPVGNR